MARRVAGRGKDVRAAARTDRRGFRPSREEILRYIIENPDRAGKREIARAFSLKAGDRIWLKDLLRDMQLASLLHKGVFGDPTVLPARSMIEMATIGGASVLGLGSCLALHHTVGDARCA